MVNSPFEDMDLAYDPLETEETKANTSGERSLDKQEFEELLNGAGKLQPKDDLQTEFSILLLGRLGLRVGELTHLRESWVDWTEQWIQIPPHQPCDRGRGGGLCGSCEGHAQQMANVNDIDVSEVRQLFWKPKTAKAVRSVPFSFSDRCERIIERYFEELPIDKFAGSESWVRRRLDDALTESDLGIDHLRPHDLRATAANYHADTGLDVYALKSFMGWSRSETAERYMRDSRQRTKKVFETFHSME